MLTAPLTIFVCFHYHYHKKKFLQYMHGQKNAVEFGFIILYIQSNWFSFFHFLFSFRRPMSDVWYLMFNDDRPSSIPPKIMHPPLSIKCELWIWFIIIFHICAILFCIYYYRFCTISVSGQWISLRSWVPDKALFISQLVYNCFIAPVSGLFIPPNDH